MAQMTPEERAERLEKMFGGGFTEEDYKYLLRTYNSLAAEYKGMITPRLQMNLIDLAKWRLEREKAVKAGDTQSAKRLSDMIKATMDSEAMKVGDSKQVEALRVDGLAERLERKGLMQDGMLQIQKVVGYIRKDAAQFNMSRDAIDAMMLSMVNAYRFNNGLADLIELPEDMKVQDKLGEFLETPTEFEKGLRNELGMNGGGDADG